MNKIKENNNHQDTPRNNHQINQQANPQNNHSILKLMYKQINQLSPETYNSLLKCFLAIELELDINDETLLNNLLHKFNNDTTNPSIFSERFAEYKQELGQL